MQVYRNFLSIPDKHRGGVIAIGNFDGVHQGHLKVIETAGKLACKENIPWGVLTFEPHPRSFFGVEDKFFRLTPFRTKVGIIKSLEVDFMLVLKFNSTLSNMTSQSFISQVLVEGLNAKKILSGKDFVFGKNREGSIKTLKKSGQVYGFESIDLDQVQDNSGQIISSTRIRDYLKAGQPEKVSSLLGRNFEIEGRVIYGDKRGREIGFPTANVQLNNQLLPALGVYAVRVQIKKGNTFDWYDGICNLGYRPTIGGDECLLETHIFNFSNDIYEQNIRVSLIEFIRPEKKFDNINMLKEQIKTDAKCAIEILDSKTLKTTDNTTNVLEIE